MANPISDKAISVWREMVAYETLWGMPNATLKQIAALFQSHPTLPSLVLEALRSQTERLTEKEWDALIDEVERYVAGLNGFSVSIHKSFQYPSGLRQAKYPIEMFYYVGDIGYTESKCVSIVGSRESSENGVKRAWRLAEELVEADYTIVSGLAKGIDTAAMKSAIVSGGRTIGVIGTPINQFYPKENERLQRDVAKSHLLISQVPFYRYSKQPFRTKRYYFPERNATMSAISSATIIVEAGETSGTLTQAHACMEQGRKLFILQSCFDNPNISWPERFEKQGAIRVRETSDVLAHLTNQHTSNGMG